MFEALTSVRYHLGSMENIEYRTMQVGPTFPTKRSLVKHNLLTQDNIFLVLTKTIPKAVFKLLVREQLRRE